MTDSDASTDAVGPAPVEQPVAIRLAQRLMYVAAGLTLVGAVFVGPQSIASTIRRLARGDEGFRSELGMVAVMAIVVWAVGVGIVVGIWLWMAWANGTGQKWARITATAFFGLSAFGTIRSLGSSAFVLNRIGDLVVWLLGGVAVYLLWAGDGSKQYYEFMSWRPPRPTSQPIQPQGEDR